MKISIILSIAFAVFCVGKTSAAKKLETVFEWHQINFKYETEDKRSEAIKKGEFIQKNVIPVGLEVTENRLLLTFSRLKTGVPASLAYVYLNESGVEKSPSMTPYPSWAAHTSLSPQDRMEIVSPTAIKVDRCEHLWIVDAIGNGKLQLLAYDLRSDNLIERYDIPKAKSAGDSESTITSIAVEDHDCGNIFVYLADPGAPALIVFSMKEKHSWRVHHNFFHLNPLFGNFSVDGVPFQRSDGVYGLALSDKNKNGFADLYFHPLSSLDEFKVSTAILRNESLATSGLIYDHFVNIGSRDLDGQAGASSFDPSTGVIFYAMLNKNQLSCWRTSMTNYTIKNGNVYSDPFEMNYPSDVKVSQKNEVWVLTNNWPKNSGDQLDAGIINYRVLKASVKDAIKDTDCDINFFKHALNTINKIGDKLRPGTAASSDKKNGSASQKPLTFTTAFVIALTILKAKLF